MSAPASVRSFPSLPLGPGSAPALGSRVRICIVSPEFVGPSRNGGIGTAYTALAEALSHAGHEVVCLYTKGAECASNDIAYWVDRYRARGLRLVPLKRAGAPLDAIGYSVMAYDVYAWLKQADTFDVVHFPDWQALGYHAQVAKRLGVAFARTHFCVGLHSMTAWLKFANQEHLANPIDLQLDFMERQTVALADSVVSPSRYLLEWIAARGWTLPDQAFVHQNIVPQNARGIADAARQGVQSTSEIVFFGRLETRKGVQLFCDAVDRLQPLLRTRATRITFLGKDAKVGHVGGEQYVRHRAQAWDLEVQFLNDLDQVGAMAYLRGDGRLAVIPSLIENSPYTVLECLGAGISFLASRVGGIPELIDAVDAEAVCFEAKPAALASRLEAVLMSGAPIARAAQSAEQTERRWIEWHEQQAATMRNLSLPAPPVDWPKVSLCVTTYNRPTLLRQALASIEQLDYPALEVVLVDDGSTQPEVLAYLDELAPKFAARGWQIVRQKNRYLGAARNTGARNATGDLLLFMDDDNYAEPREVKVLVCALLHSGADIVSCGMNYFSGEAEPKCNAAPTGRWLPLGAAASAGAFVNCFGDANALVRRACFEAVGGFTEDYGVTHEDWEFHARAVLQGFNLQVVPEFLFWYRVSADSMYRTLSPYPNFQRSIRPYLEAVPEPLQQLVLFAQGSALQAMNVTGAGGPWAAYAALTVRWRSKLEAGLALEEAGHPELAAKTMLAGVKAIEGCKVPAVILEALLEICAQLGRLDSGRARYLLGIATNLADSLRRPEDKKRAEMLLHSLHLVAARPSAPSRPAHALVG